VKAKPKGPPMPPVGAHRCAPAPLEAHIGNRGRMEALAAE